MYERASLQEGNGQITNSFNSTASVQGSLPGSGASLLRFDNVHVNTAHEGYDYGSTSGDSTARPNQNDNAHDRSNFESLLDKQEYIQELKAAFKNLEDCKCTNAEVNFIKGATDAQFELWSGTLLESIVRRQAQGSSLPRKDRRNCEHSDEYAQFDQRFAAVKKILKTEKRACRRFLTMPDKVWADRLADDPVFERDSIMVNDNINSSRGQRLQNVKDNSKDIFQYLEKLGKEGVLAGDEYRAILGLAKYNMAPAKVERQSSTKTLSKRKFGHHLDDTTASGGSEPETHLASSRSIRVGDGARFTDADQVEDIDSTITSMKRRKLNNEKILVIGQASDLNMAPAAQGEAIRKFSKSVCRPEDLVQNHAFSKAITGRPASAAYSTTNSRVNEMMQSSMPQRVPNQMPFPGVQGQYNLSQHIGRKQNAGYVETPDRQSLVSFPQQPQNLPVLEQHNHGKRGFSGGVENLHMPRLAVYRGSYHVPSTEATNATDSDEFSEFINY